MLFEFFWTYPRVRADHGVRPASPEISIVRFRSARAGRGGAAPIFGATSPRVRADRGVRPYLASGLTLSLSGSQVAPEDAKKTNSTMRARSVCLAALGSEDSRLSVKNGISKHALHNCVTPPRYTRPRALRNIRYFAPPPAASSWGGTGGVPPVSHRRSSTV